MVLSRSWQIGAVCYDREHRQRMIGTVWPGLKQLGHFFFLILVSCVVCSKCNSFACMLGGTVNTKSALWILMVWCFTIRTSVSTVLMMHRWLSSCLWVNIVVWDSVQQWKLSQWQPIQPDDNPISHLDSISVETCNVVKIKYWDKYWIIRWTTLK